MKRIRWIVSFSVLAVALVVPAGASAELSPSDFKNASKFCKAVRAEMGDEAFRNAYGKNRNKRNAHGKCVSKHVRGLDVLARNAAKECKAERTADPVGFEQKYGSDESRPKRGEGERRGPPEHAKPNARAARNAFGRCVRSKVRAAKAELRASLDKAARECHEERASDPEAFRTKYGTNHNKRNAFGKCVVEHVRNAS